MIDNIISYIYNNAKAQKQRALEDKYYNNQLSNINAQMNAATSAFNRAYYRNYTDNASVQNMLKRVRDQLSEQNKASQKTAVVMGVTPDMYAAMQKQNNQILDKVVGNVAAAESNARERAEANFEAQRQNLYNMRMQVNNQHNQRLYEFDIDDMERRSNFILPLLSNLVSW